MFKKGIFLVLIISIISGCSISQQKTTNSEATLSKSQKVNILLDTACSLTDTNGNYQGTKDENGTVMSCVDWTCKVIFQGETYTKDCLDN